MPSWRSSRLRRPTPASRRFLKSVVDDDRRKDCQTLVRVMKRAVGAAAQDVGYRASSGSATITTSTPSGRENDWFLAGFSPRKQDLTLYIMAGFDRYDALMSKLGEYAQDRKVLPLHQAARRRRRRRARGARLRVGQAHDSERLDRRPGRGHSTGTVTLECPRIPFSASSHGPVVEDVAGAGSSSEPDSGVSESARFTQKPPFPRGQSRLTVPGDCPG